MSKKYYLINDKAIKFTHKICTIKNRGRNLSEVRLLDDPSNKTKLIFTDGLVEITDVYTKISNLHLQSIGNSQKLVNIIYNNFLKGIYPSAKDFKEMEFIYNINKPKHIQPKPIQWIVP